MTRRTIGLLVALVLLVAALAAEAQPPGKVYRTKLVTTSWLIVIFGEAVPLKR